MGIFLISGLLAVIIIGGLGGLSVAVDKTAKLSYRCLGGLSCFVVVGILLTILALNELGPRNTACWLLLFCVAEFLYFRTPRLRMLVWTALGGHVICAAVFFAVAYHYGWLESYVLVDEMGRVHHYDFTDWYGLMGILAIRVLVVHWFYLNSARK